LRDGDRILLGTLPLVFRNPTEQGWDFLAAEPPPKAAEPTPEDEVSTPRSEIPSGMGRVARRVDRTGTAEQEAQAPQPKAKEEEPPAEPEEEPSEQSAPQPQESVPAEGSRPQAPAAEAELALPFWKRFGPLEIVAALIGVIILLGSVWLLLKLL
jgi:hypothetical protein